MYNSDTPAEPADVKLHVRAADSSAELFVIDAGLSIAARGIGDIEVRLVPGLYKVLARIGAHLEKKDAILWPDKSVVFVEFEPFNLPTAAPLGRDAPLAHVADVQSSEEHLADGHGSWIYLFVSSSEDASAPGESHPGAALSLFDSAGRSVASFRHVGMAGHEDGAAWFACVARVDPGAYRLACKTPDATLARTIYAPVKWQVQVFAKAAKGENGQFLPDLANASIFLAPRDRGFESNFESHRLTETARIALHHGRASISRDYLEQVLKADGFDNPMFGIFAGHALLQNPESNHDLLKKIVIKLREAVRFHPDVEAIAIAAGIPSTARFADPPMLVKSWQQIVKHSIGESRLVPEGSLSARIATRLWGIGPWLSWLDAPSVALVRATMPPQELAGRLSLVKFPSDQLERLDDFQRAVLNRLPSASEWELNSRPTRSKRNAGKNRLHDLFLSHLNSNESRQFWQAQDVARLLFIPPAAVSHTLEELHALATELQKANARQEVSPGQRVYHAVHGSGAVMSAPRNGFVRVFFASGEQFVAIDTLSTSQSHTDRLLDAIAGGEARRLEAWLHYEAHCLRLMYNAIAFASAPVELLPHQIVLAYRIAIASPRRFLIADEVGLGKTIETALVLREIASRGELNRVLLVVPAGLVHNWHCEMNEVFHLNFEIFGNDGDVTDRRSNAFAKHDRLIASIDALKRPKRIQRLLDAPPWDMVVFDEAHHLTAVRRGKTITKTQNYKLAEALNGRTRDMLFLSATPHQGDNFRFWMLINLLNSGLFDDAEGMTENRDRLNSVVFRRTKADACRADGSPLFARRSVSSIALTMSETESVFYKALCAYLKEGFALAARQENQKHGIEFVMKIFQKIAASSFCAIRDTLRRRLLNLTLRETNSIEQRLDATLHDRMLDESRALVHDVYGVPDDPLGRARANTILAELQRDLVKKSRDAEREVVAHIDADESGTESDNIAIELVELPISNERVRITELLSFFPKRRESKITALMQALDSVWGQKQDEKIIIFATYLSTVDLITRELEQGYPNRGVVVLRGGDRDAKLAAIYRFRDPNGPQVLVCTAAGHEGINLQFARILFNFDLPWNPMVIEQRIGRIHRYGQQYTAQVYNLVLSDTVEGQIFASLEEKLQEIAKALGKVDEGGNVAEDFRSQVLGQLSEQLPYDRLYRNALSDAELRRTREEIEIALSNAAEARDVVSELFQDLQRFSIADYQPFSDTSAGRERLVHFLGASVATEGKRLVVAENGTVAIVRPNQDIERTFTFDRDLALARPDLELVGIDHPIMQSAIDRWQRLPPDRIGIAVVGPEGPATFTCWLVKTRTPSGEQTRVVHLAVGQDGQRKPQLEQMAAELFALHSPAEAHSTTPDARRRLLHDVIEPMLQRELQQQGIVAPGGSYSSEIIGWVEIVPAAN